MKAPRQAPSSHTTRCRNHHSYPLRFGRDRLRVGGQRSPPGLRGFLPRASVRCASATSQALGRRSAGSPGGTSHGSNGGQCQRSTAPPRPLPKLHRLLTTAHIAACALLHSHQARPTGRIFTRAARRAALRHPLRHFISISMNRPPAAALPDRTPSITRPDNGRCRVAHRLVPRPGFFDCTTPGRTPWLCCTTASRPTSLGVRQRWQGCAFRTASAPGRKRAHNGRPAASSAPSPGTGSAAARLASPSRRAFARARFYSPSSRHLRSTAT